MAEIGLAEYFGIGEALGIIGTMIIVLYFSRKQMQSLSADIESKVLNDLDEKVYNMAEMLVNKPELVEVLVKRDAPEPPKLVFAYYVLYMCSLPKASDANKVAAGDVLDDCSIYANTMTVPFI